MRQHFKELIDTFEVDRRVIADHLGMSHGTITGLIEGTSQFSEEVVKKLTEKFPINVGYLFQLSQDMWTDPSFKPEEVFPKSKIKRVTEIKKGINPTVCDRVKMVRKDQDFTQHDFATEIQIERHIQTSIENYRQNPTVEYMALLNLRFGVNLNYIITGIGPMYLGSKEGVSQDDYHKMEHELSQAKVMIDLLTEKLKS